MPINLDRLHGELTALGGGRNQNLIDEVIDLVEDLSTLNQALEAREMDINEVIVLQDEYLDGLNATISAAEDTFTRCLNSFPNLAQDQASECLKSIQLHYHQLLSEVNENIRNYSVTPRL